MRFNMTALVAGALWTLAALWGLEVLDERTRDEARAAVYLPAPR